MVGIFDLSIKQLDNAVKTFLKIDGTEGRLFGAKWQNLQIAHKFKFL